MSRKNRIIPQYENFFKSVKLTLKDFADKFNVTYTSYFADKLDFTSSNKEAQFSQLLNNSDKDLTVRELIFLLNILKEDSKPILDYLANEANLIVSLRATPLNHLEEIKDVLMKFQVDNGLLSANFLTAFEDGVLTHHEILTLKQLSYQFRARLNQFEFMLDEIKDKTNEN